MGDELDHILEDEPIDLVGDGLEADAEAAAAAVAAATSAAAVGGRCERRASGEVLVSGGAIEHGSGKQGGGIRARKGRGGIGGRVRRRGRSRTFVAALSPPPGCTFAGPGVRCFLERELLLTSSSGALRLRPLPLRRVSAAPAPPREGPASLTSSST